MTFFVNFAKSSPPIDCWDRSGRACQVQSIVVVASSIAYVIHRISLAGVDMICRESEVTGSEFLLSFYKGSAEASFNVELNVAVEEPNTYHVSISCGSTIFLVPTWVVGLKPDDSIALVLNHESVSSDGRGWQVRVCSTKRTGFGK